MLGIEKGGNFVPITVNSDVILSPVLQSPWQNCVKPKSSIPQNTCLSTDLLHQWKYTIFALSCRYSLLLSQYRGRVGSCTKLTRRPLIMKVTINSNAMIFLRLIQFSIPPAIVLGVWGLQSSSASEALPSSEKVNIGLGKGSLHVEMQY